MDREEAARALDLLKKVVTQARDDTALQNWGVIWLVHAVTNGGGFITTNLLIWRGVTGELPYIALWIGIVAFNIGSIFVLKARRAGARTFIETQIWAIWLTFIAAVILTELVNKLLGLELFFLAPMIAVLSAAGFAQMGSIMGRRWYLGTAVFIATAIAMALVRDWQFIILGSVWGVAQLAGGIWLEVERRRRLASGQAQARLV